MLVNLLRGVKGDLAHRYLTILPLSPWPSQESMSTETKGHQCHASQTTLTVKRPSRRTCVTSTFQGERRLSFLFDECNINHLQGVSQFMATYSQANTRTQDKSFSESSRGLKGREYPKYLSSGSYSVMCGAKCIAEKQLAM